MTLPCGWANALLLDIVDLHDSRRVPLNAGERAVMPGEYPYYGANGQVGSVGKYIFEGRHILLAEDGGYFDQPERGVAYEVDGKFWVNNHAHVLSTCGEIPASFLVRLLNTIDWRDYVSGSTRLKLTQGGMQRIKLPIPPLAEQRRILTKLDALAARLSRARAELDRVLDLAEHLRRTTLRRAVSGELTRDLRDASVNAEATAYPKLDDQERGTWHVEALPTTWAWVDFDEFFDDRTDAKRKLPEKDYETNGPFPVVDQGQREVGGYTSREDLVHPVTEPVLIFGDHTRCVKMVAPPFVQGADGVKVLAAAEGVNINYARMALLAVDIPAKGYSRHMKFVRKTVWPLPPEDEQLAIVARAAAVFARVDRMETEAARARVLLDSLEAAILTRTFRGELVRQDPADEPASALLARIQAQRADRPELRRGRKSGSSVTRRT